MSLDWSSIITSKVRKIRFEESLVTDNVPLTNVYRKHML